MGKILEPIMDNMTPRQINLVGNTSNGIFYMFIILILVVIVMFILPSTNVPLESAYYGVAISLFIIIIVIAVLMLILARMINDANR